MSNVLSVLPARPAGQPDDGEPGGAEPRCRRCGVPRQKPQGALQGADARRRRAGPQDRGRSAAPPGAGGSGPAARTARRRSSTFDWRAAKAPPNGSASSTTSQARPHRRRPRHDLRRRRLRAPGRPAHGLRQNPVQRCWAHKIRNNLNKVRKADEPMVKADLHAVRTPTRKGARRGKSSPAAPFAAEQPP